MALGVTAAVQVGARRTGGKRYLSLLPEAVGLPVTLPMPKAVGVEVTSRVSV